MSETMSAVATSSSSAKTAKTTEEELNGAGLPEEEGKEMRLFALCDKTFAMDALNDFNKKNYKSCINNLNVLNISSTSRRDHRVLHNLRVAEFYESGFKKYVEFNKKLRKIYCEFNENQDTFKLSDLTHAIGYFNLAVILFHMRQPKATLKIMLTIMEHIIDFDELFCQHAGLLTINLLLNTNQPKKAIALIELMQKHLTNTFEIANSDDDIMEPISDPLKENTLKSLMLLDDFKSMFKLYKYRALLLNGEKCIIPNIESCQMCVLRGHQYYLGHDYQMAAKELAKAFTNLSPNIKINGEDYHTVIGNNMGLVHFHVKHYAMATFFFQNAFTADQRAADNSANEPPLQCVGASKRPEILYNLGISLLHLQRPKEAFECLLVPLNYYHNNPRLWLRLAEACIMVHKQNLKEKESTFITTAVISSGLHRKYILHPNSVKYLSDDSQSFGIPSTNLEFASLCLRNSLALIISYENDFVQSADSSETIRNPENWKKISEKSQCNPSKPLTKLTFDKLKCAVLTAYSYVQLSLGEYTLALKYAKELIQLDYLPDAYAMLGHIYSAEALVMLDRIPEALLYLQPEFIANLTDDDFIHRGSPDWDINSLEKAQAILKYNSSVTHVLLGDHQEAQKLLLECTHDIVFPYMKRLKMYMELYAGNIENCKRMVRIDTPQYFKHFPYY